MTDQRVLKSSVAKTTLLEPWFVGTSLSPSLEERTELNWLSYAFIWSQAPGNIVCKVDQDHIRLVSGLPSGFLNGVVWGGSASVENLESRVSEVTASLKEEMSELSAPCEWSIAASQPYQRELQEALCKNGWIFHYDVPGSTCELSGDGVATRLPDNFKIEPVRSPEQVRAWLDPFIEGFNTDKRSRSYLQAAFERVSSQPDYPMRNFLLSIEGEPVTSGSVQFRYGVAVIYNICTLSERRNQGGATHMVNFLKEEALREGYSSVSLFALEAGRPIYEKIGFRLNKAITRVYKLRG